MKAVADYLDTDKIFNGDEDRVRIVPKTTAMLAFYPILCAAGLLPEERLARYGSVGLRPIPHQDEVGIDATNYIIGPVFGYAVGLALAARIKRSNHQTICFLGDGELQAGADQAAKAAVQFGLDNLTVVVDCNGLQGFYPTALGDPTMRLDSQSRLRPQQRVWRAYGWKVAEIDGHDFRQICEAYARIGKQRAPYVILARTRKGKGIPCVEGHLGFHHRLPPDVLDEARRLYSEVVAKSGAKIRRRRRPPPKMRRTIRVVAPSGFTKNDFPPAGRADQLRPIAIAWLQQLTTRNPHRVILLDADCPRLFCEDGYGDVFSPDNPDCPHVFPGLNEKLAFAVAKSLAYEGLLPIVVSPAVFLTNSVEEWNGICMDKAPVLCIGTKPGGVMSDWGPSHCGFDDLVSFSRPNASILQPSNARDLVWVLTHLLEDAAQYLPAYVRLIDFDVATDVSAESMPHAWEQGYYVACGQEHRSSYLALIASGTFMRQALELVEQHGNNRRIKVINLFNLGRVSVENLRDDLDGATRIVSLMEGRASTVSEMVFTALSPGQKAAYEPVCLDCGAYVEDPALLQGDSYNAWRLLLTRSGLDSQSLARRLDLL